MTIKEFLTKLIRLVLGRGALAAKIVNGISVTRPEIVESLMPLLVRRHGESVLKALSTDQQLAVLRQLWRDRRMDVVHAVNAQADAGFRYVGKEVTSVVLGSGGDEFDGWLSTDIKDLDIVAETSWQRLFLPASIDRLVAEHVFEHLSLSEILQAFRHIRAFLKPGGRLRLAVPDAFHPSRYYYNLVKPGGWETPFEHKIFLDHEILTRMGTEAGLEVELLEYFDSDGIFHAAPYDEREGAIRRCASNNLGLDTADPEVMASFYASIPDHLRQQFRDRGMTYTSLIADLVRR